MVTVEQLLARRQAVIDRHKNLETLDSAIPWHPDHPEMRARLRKGEAMLSERIVAIQDDDHVHVVGECVAKVKATARKFLEKVEGDPGSDHTGLGTALSFQKAVVSKLERVLAGSDEHIDLFSLEWNCVTAALGAMNVQVVLTGLK